MKRKLCLALALAMVLSMFASMSAFAVGQFTPGVASTVYLDAWTDTDGNLGLGLEDASTELYFVDFCIKDNAGFMAADLWIRFDHTKYRIAGDGNIDYDTATIQEVATIANLNGYAPAVDSSGVTQGIPDGRAKRNLQFVPGAQKDENGWAAAAMFAGDAHYATADGIIFEFAFVARDGVTPSLDDFAIQVNSLKGAGATEDLVPLLVNENPYVPGGTVEPATKDITVAFNEGGAINVNGVAATNGQVFTVGEDETIAADIVPAEGYYCSSYVLDGATVENTEVGTIAGLTVSESLSATFEAIPVLEPVISQEAEVDGTYYAQIANFENIGDLDYGFKLTVTKKVVNGLTIERPDEVYFCSVKGKNGANTLGQFGAIIEVLRATECDFTVEAIIVAANE